LGDYPPIRTAACAVSRFTDEQVASILREVDTTANIAKNTARPAQWSNLPVNVGPYLACWDLRLRGRVSMSVEWTGTTVVVRKDSQSPAWGLIYLLAAVAVVWVFVANAEFQAVLFAGLALGF